MLIDVRWWLLEGGLSVHTSQQLSFVLSDQQDSYQTILACLKSSHSSMLHSSCRISLLCFVKT